MLHEALFAISGHESDVFKHNAMPDHFPEISQSERDSLNRLVSLGSYYSCIRAFINARSPSIITRALQIALETHVSRPYNALIVDLESKLLNQFDPDMNGLKTSPSMLIVEFQKVIYFFLLPVLYHIPAAGRALLSSL